MTTPTQDQLSMNGYCSNCIAVPLECGYEYATKEQCKCSCHVKPDTSKQDWKERFDEKFLAFRDPDIVDGFARNEIIKFIQQEIDKAVEGERKRIYKSIEEAINIKYPYRFIEETEYGKGTLMRGVQMATEVRRTTLTDLSHLSFLEFLQDKIKNV